MINVGALVNAVDVIGFVLEECIECAPVGKLVDHGAAEPFLARRVGDVPAREAIAFIDRPQVRPVAVDNFIAARGDIRLDRKSVV